MNAKEMYLAWLRTDFPDVYRAMMMKLANQPRNVGGLADDLVDTSFTPELQDVSLDTSSVTLSPDVTATIDANASSVDQSSFWTNVVNTVGNVATTAFKTDQQNQLLKLNTQRVAMGQPPVNANGVPIQTSYFRSTSPTLAALESKMAGAATPTTMLMVGGGLLALLFFMRKRRG